MKGKKKYWFMSRNINILYILSHERCAMLKTHCSVLEADQKPLPSWWATDHFDVPNQRLHDPFLLFHTTK